MRVSAAVRFGYRPCARRPSGLQELIGELVSRVGMSVAARAPGVLLVGAKSAYGPAAAVLTAAAGPWRFPRVTAHHETCERCPGS